MRYITTLVLVLTSLVCQAEENYPYTVQCPAKQQQATLTSVKMAYGYPSDVIIISSSSLQEYHGELKESFYLPSANKVWAICGYGYDNSIALSKQLPSTVRECIVEYYSRSHNEKRVLEVKRIACK